VAKPSRSGQYASGQPRRPITTLCLDLLRLGFATAAVRCKVQHAPPAARRCFWIDAASPRAETVPDLSEIFECSL